MRSNELRHQLKFPYSIFIESKREKKIITIHEKNSNKLIIKHWKLKNCKIDQRLPPFDEFEIVKEEVFISSFVIIPGFDLLWYKEQSYNSTKFRAEIPFISSTEKEYKECLENFLNSKRHKEMRDNWLWDSFTTTYSIEKGPFYFLTADHLNTLRRHHPKFSYTWTLWKKYLLDFSMETGQIAGELLFQKEYLKKAKKEGKIIL